MQIDNANVVRVCLITGLRVGDVLTLTRDKLHPDGAINTVCEKTGKPFSGSIPPKFALDLLHRAGKSDWVFPSPVRRCSGKHRTRQAVWRDLKHAAKICAVGRNVTPHSARKIFAVEKFRKNGIEVAQSALQHDRLSTTLLYAFSDQIANERERDQPDRVKAASIKVEQVLDQFYEAFGGREYFAQCLARLIGDEVDVAQHQPHESERRLIKKKRKTVSKN